MHYVSSNGIGIGVKVSLTVLGMMRMVMTVMAMVVATGMIRSRGAVAQAHPPPTMVSTLFWQMPSAPVSLVGILMSHGHIQL